MNDPAQCRNCLKPLKGRFDKKFCCDQCRSSWHNQQRQTATHMRLVNLRLRENRQILATCHANNLQQISIRELEARGFHFSYFTSSTNDGTRQVYEFSYWQIPGTDQITIQLLEWQGHSR